MSKKICIERNIKGESNEINIVIESKNEIKEVIISYTIMAINVKSICHCHITD